MKPNVVIVGYQPKRGVPLDDYLDFPVGSRFNWLEASVMAHDGHFPPGIMLQADGGGPVCIIEGEYCHEQTAVAL